MIAAGSARETFLVNSTFRATAEANPDLDSTKLVNLGAKKALKALRRAGREIDDRLEEEVFQWALDVIDGMRIDKTAGLPVGAADLPRRLHAALPHLSPDERGDYLRRPEEAERLIAEKQQRDRRATLDAHQRHGAGFDPTAILSAATLDELADPEPLIEGHINESTVVGFNGETGSGKTAVAIQMVGSIATGLSFLGEYQVTGPRRALLALGEGASGARKRVKAFAIDRELTVRQRALLDANLVIYPRAINLLDPRDVEGMRRYVTAEGIDFIVLDTLTTHTRGFEENSAGSMGDVLDAARSLIIHRPKGAVLITHHPGKGKGVEGRGSGAWKNGLDGELATQRDGDLISLSVEKAKDGPTGQKRIYRLKVVQIPESTSARGLYHPGTTSIVPELVPIGVAGMFGSRKPQTANERRAEEIFSLVPAHNVAEGISRAEMIAARLSSNDEKRMTTTNAVNLLLKDHRIESTGKLEIGAIERFRKVHIPTAADALIFDETEETT